MHIYTLHTFYIQFIYTDIYTHIYTHTHTHISLIPLLIHGDKFKTSFKEKVDIFAK